RREDYVGQWLPEPVITGGHDDPARHAEMADSLSLAMLVLLESLSPEQRAVLLLHDVFGYGHAQIAPIIGTSPDNVRQLARRAPPRPPRPAPRRAAPAALPGRPRAAPGAGPAVLPGRRGRRPAGAGGTARPRRGADRRRRRQGPGARAVAARPHPCRAHADRL